MTSGKTEAFATRISNDGGERVEEAARETSLSKSDLLARALRFYMAKNPDDIAAFYSDTYREGPLERAKIMSPPSWIDWPKQRDQ
jgi:hypothetical protein